VLYITYRLFGVNELDVVINGVLGTLQRKFPSLL
jgi:hypothetical protein